MDGPTLVRTARAQYPDLKILFMSGYAEEQLRKSIDIDRVAFLSKPFSVQQLGQAARDAILAPTPRFDAGAVNAELPMRLLHGCTIGPPYDRTPFRPGDRG